MKFELHHHSLFSLNDGKGTIAETKSFCEEHGVEAIAFTDHGQCMSHDAVKTIFADSPVKAIYGVEAYVMSPLSATLSEDDDEEENSTIAHFILLAKDYIGLKAINRMVTAGYDNMFNGKPVIPQAIIKQYCAEGAPAHGHIVAMSACMQGVLGVELRKNEFIEKKAQKLINRASRIDIDMGAYEDMSAKVGEMTDELEELRERRQTLGVLKNKKYTSRQKQVEKLKGTPTYEQELAALQEEMLETEEAVKEFPVAKAEEAALSKQLTSIKGELKKLEGKVARIQAATDEANALRETMLDDETLYANAVAVAQYYQEMFGADFFAELQYHGIPAEASCFPIIADIAEELGIEIVATNDSHVLANTEENFRSRQILRSLRFNKWEEEMTGDRELYVKTDDEVRDMLLQIIPARVVDKAIANTEVVANMCNVEFPKEDHYPRFISPDGRTAIRTLKDLCNEGFRKLSFKNPEERKMYIDRTRYELEVIEKLGVVDYLLIVQDFLAYGRLLGKIDINDPRFLADPYNVELLKELGKGNVGMSIGIGRGSAVGSLVCYLIGITNADPIKYNLLFERFLNTERVTMPDIDSDFAPDIRGLVLNYVKHKYGNEAVCCIATIGTQGVKNAIRNCGRLLGDAKYGDSKKTLPLVSEICAAVPEGVGVKFSDCANDLYSKFAGNEDAIQILNDAQLVEGTFTTIGMHAAGVIIADNGDVGEYTALMKSKDGQWVSQCDMNYTEAKGLLKMDFLGLNNLAIITETLRTIQKNYGVNIEMSEVDLADADVYANIFAKGNTDSVFQFESDGMKRMLQDFKPSTIEDLILLVAAYRPGPLQYLTEIIETKSSGKKPQYIIPEMEDVLGVTYGKTIYQEQVMAVLNRFAGFSLGESDIIRRYMSKKKKDKMAAYEPKFVDGMVKYGASEEDAKDFWNQLMDFSAYAFNKSHACAYAITAYYTGWLKFHYTKEYLAAVANLSDFEKVSSIVSNIRDFGIDVKAPDVNASDATFSTTDGIRYGLSNIKGVASAAYDIVDERNAHGPFVDFNDFISRVNPRKDVVVALICAGALDSLDKRNVSFWIKRNQMLAGYVDDEISGKNSFLNEEFKYLGVYATENPSTGIAAKNALTDLASMAGKTAEVAGIASNFEEKTSSKDGRTFGVFTIVDANYKSVPAVCFSDAYAEFKDVITSGPCRFIGKVNTRNGELNFVVNKVETATAAVKTIVLTPEKANSIKPYIPLYSKYKSDDGVPLLFIIRGKTVSFGIKVSIDILNDAELAPLLTVI